MCPNPCPGLCPLGRVGALPSSSLCSLSPVLQALALQGLTPSFLSLCPLTQQQSHSETGRKRALGDIPVTEGSGQEMEITRGLGEARRPGPRAPPCCPSKCLGGCDHSHAPHPPTPRLSVSGAHLALGLRDLLLPLSIFSLSILSSVWTSRLSVHRQRKWGFGEKPDCEWFHSGYER